MFRPPAAALDYGQDVTLRMQKRVHVHHPGYSGHDNILITLLAADGVEGGLDQNTVHVISAIIAANRFDGYLATDAAGLDRVATTTTTVLAPGDYYFHVPSPVTDPLVNAGTQNAPLLDAPVVPRPDRPTMTIEQEQTTPYRYPVVPFFDSWAFPRHGLPAAWTSVASAPSRSSLQASFGAVRERDRTCRITNRSEVVEYAHIIPKRDGGWFAWNGMGRLASLGRRDGEDKKDDADNMILLRSDIHTLWDSKDFVLVPKTVAQGQVALVAHVMHASTELLALYHNMEAQPLIVPVEYLFARLAWAVFDHVKPFLQSDRPRTLTVRDRDEGTFHTGVYTSKQCHLLLSDRARSKSPKRRRAEDTEQLDEHDMEESQHRVLCVDTESQGSNYTSSYNVASTSHTTLDDDHLSEEDRFSTASDNIDDSDMEETAFECRGRKRRRLSLDMYYARDLPKSALPPCQEVVSLQHPPQIVDD